LHTKFWYVPKCNLLEIILFFIIWNLFFLGLEETDEITNEIKFEPESPTAQFPLSPSSLNHSESNDSDRQMKCYMPETSNYMMQNVKTEVYSGL
jgi:hypothetical protein